VFIEKEPEDIGEKANKIEEGGRILFVNMEENVRATRAPDSRRILS